MDDRNKDQSVPEDSDSSQQVHVDLPITQTRKDSGYIKKVIDSAFKTLNSDNQRIDFARALYMSVKIDRTQENPLRPQSGLAIRSECPALGISSLQGYGILIQKTEARKFLLDFGVPKISATSFSKNHTVNSYEKLFKRKATTVKRETLLCTYAEWIHMYGDFLYEPELPQSVLDLIPEGWEMPDRNSPEGNPPVSAN